MKYVKEDALKALQGSDSSEVFLFTPDEHAQYLDNYKKVEIEKELKGRIAKVYSDIDNDFTEVTGLKRPEDQKTYKYWKEKMKEYKDASESADTSSLKEEIARLKKDGNPDMARELEQLRKLSLEREKQWKSEKDALLESMTKKDVMTKLDAALIGVKFSDLPEPVKTTFIESAKSKLIAQSKIINGEVVFVDENGDPLINKETYKPYTATDMMLAQLDPIIDKGHSHKGSGVKPEVTTGKDGKIDVTVNIPSGIKSKSELTKYLIEVAALPFNTPEHNAAYDKYCVQMGL